METKQKRTKVVVSVMALAALVVFSLTAGGGNLEPTTPPGPTMKTLDEVEPRIPIPASDTAVGTFTISESGSYYLAGDRLCSSTGIQVDANNVTIDLMGYSLIGPGPGSGYDNHGIYMAGRSNVEIRNGTIRDFGFNGIRELWGDTGKGHRVISVRALSNAVGISLYGRGHLIKDCTAVENRGDGIYGGFGSTVTGNTAYNNSYGISTGDGSTITANTVYSNTNRGIIAGNYCLVDQNTAYLNGTNMVTGTGCQVGLNVAP